MPEYKKGFDKFFCLFLFSKSKTSLRLNQDLIPTIVGKKQWVFC